MSAALDLAAELGHERLHLLADPDVGLRAAVAIHSTALGVAAGGTRMRVYPSFDAAVVDALRLSRAMTYKCAYAGLAYGGAKAVIDADPARAKTPELLAAFGRAVAELGDRFVSGGDMGIDEHDVAYLARFAPAFAYAPRERAPNPSELTAIGVAAAIAALAGRWGRTLDGLEVVVQGVGEVGGRLARRLATAGARLTVADADAERARRVAAETGARGIAAAAVYEVACDVFSPNAAGGLLDDSRAARLPARAVCGAANNPLAQPDLADVLAARGIVYAPDFVVSAGGVLSLLFETGELDAAGTVRRVERLGADLAELLEAADREGLPPLRLAERRVEERLAAARRRR